MTLSDLYLQQLVATEELAAATYRSLWQDRADVVVTAVGLQTDTQATALTELLHLGNLTKGQESTTQLAA